MKVISTATQEAATLRQRESIKATRSKLESALERLVNDAPNIVKKGVKVSAAAVCAEAGVDRATLYRFHEPVLTAIRRINEATPNAKVKEKHADLVRARTKEREYRELAEDAQRETAALARINYRLQARVSELEEQLRNRDLIIRRYQEKAND